MGNIKEIYADLSSHYLLMLDKNEIDHYEFTVISVLLKQTVLYNKKSDGISISQWSKKTGISKRKISHILEALLSKKIIKKKRQKAPKKGYIYSRFYLTLVYEMLKVHPYAPHAHPYTQDAHTYRERNNNNKDAEIFKIDKNLVDEYLQFLISKGTIYNKDGYKARIRREIHRGDEMTIANIREWAEENKGIKI
ncbi:replication protein [Sulfurimonas sp. NWX79]|uniref:replication protein n=1 Tax=Sulfurimonas sp. NWX79 TaxID=2925412 RepID=UPI0032046547